MRERQVAAWRKADASPSVRVEFVVSLTDKEQTNHFSSNPLFVAESDSFEIRSGLASDLDGILIEIDPRQQTSPLPSIPSLVFDRQALIEAYGEVPAYPSIFRAEVALVAETMAWEDRIVIIQNAPVSHRVKHSLNGGVIYSLEDPLAFGKVQIPPDLIDTTTLPWTAAHIQKDVHGRPFPVCFGNLHRQEPLKAYDDGGTANGADAQPIRRYILCGHLVSGAYATVHRTNDAIAAQQSGGYTDLSVLIQTAETTDGIRFSYIETDGANIPSDEDPTLTPPKECHAISFEASSGDDASLGGILRKMLTGWTDIEIDEVLGSSIADLVDSMRPMKMAITINGEGADRASVSEMIDGRFANQAPLSTARYGGHLFMVSLINLFAPPGPGYLPPSASFNLDGECHVEGEVSENGEIFNCFEVRYKRRESDRWEQTLLANPETDFQCARSRDYYGIRQAPSLDLPDVNDSGAAGLILQYLRDVHLFPWYEVPIFAPHEYSWLLPAQKVQLIYDTDNVVMSSLNRFRYSLATSVSGSTTKRDAIITSVRYHRAGLIYGVIF